MQHKIFENKLCTGAISKSPSDGDVVITGKLKGHFGGSLVYWAASPPDYNTSFSGSGLPFPSAEVAFQNTQNVGKVEVVGGSFRFKINHPNSYYTKNGGVHVPPRVYFKHCSAGTEVFQLDMPSLKVPFRDSLRARKNPLFYKLNETVCITQEKRVRDTGYPKFNGFFSGKRYWFPSKR